MPGRRLLLGVLLARWLVGEPASAQSQCENPIPDLSVCPPCPSSTPLCRKPQDNFPPSVNGCGPEKFSALIEKGVIPQGYGDADFRNGGCDNSQTCGCNQHDKCYGTCNADKATCDNTFKQQLDAECARKYPVDPRGRDGCSNGMCFSSNNRLGICLSRARKYYQLVAGLGQGPYDDSQKLACKCCCNIAGAQLVGSEPRRENSLERQAGLVCAPPSWVGTASAVITDADPEYQISASITWTYDPNASSGTLAMFNAGGTVTFGPYAPDSCITITPSTVTLSSATPSGSVLQVDYSTSPPTYSGQGITGWSATYAYVCDGGVLGTLPAGGQWFMGQGQVSADGTMIAGPQSFDGQSYDFQFTQQ